MLAKGSESSYSEDFRRKRTAEKLLRRGDGGHPSLLTDRQAYISYLEVQLDRVTSSCMAVQAFSDRIQQVQDHVTLNESRLQNLTQEVHLSVAERDRNLESFGALANKLQQRLEAVEDRCKVLESQIKGVLADVPDIESQIHRIVKSNLDSMLIDNEKLETKLTRLVNQRIDALSQVQSDAERHLALMMSNHKDDLESTIRTTEKHLAISWERSAADLDGRIENLKQEVVRDLREQMGLSEIQKVRELQSRRLAQLQEQMSSLGPGMVAHLNSLSSKLTALENVDSERHRTIQDIEARARSAEQICSRIAHDVLKKVELHRQENLRMLKESSSSAVNDSFRVEMRTELRRWEEAISMLIQNTEQQIKKLADSLTSRRMTSKISSGSDENSRTTCRNPMKPIPAPDTSKNVYKSTDEKPRPPWVEVLSKWNEHRSPRRPSSSTSASAYDPGRDDELSANYESNLHSIVKTIEKLDHECQREVDFMTSPTGERVRSSKIPTETKKIATTRKSVKTSGGSTPLTKASASVKRKPQSVPIQKTINR